MMVRSSPKLFWNGVPDRIIRNKRRIILSGTPFQNIFAYLRTNMPRLLLANDEVMEFFNTLTLARQPLSTPRPPTARRSTNPRPPHVTFCLASVKGFNKTNTSSLGESNSSMMVRSSPKLFWNEVPDKIIRNKIQKKKKKKKKRIKGEKG